MTLMVALLRAVNVGGRTLPMADLRALVEGAGFAEVRTYIQSGNVVVDSDDDDPARVAGRLEEALAEGAGLATEVVVRTAAELGRALDADPFVGRGEQTGSVHLTFFAGEAPPPGDLSPFAPEEAVALGRELHLFLPNGMGRSKMAARLRRLGGTSRNWRTVTTLHDMARGEG
jgi:uncharacterized protein (DUF1697 family)